MITYVEHLQYTNVEVVEMCCAKRSHALPFGIRVDQDLMCNIHVLQDNNIENAQGSSFIWPKKILTATWQMYATPCKLVT